jgi:hypothetical protein
VVKNVIQYTVMSPIMLTPDDKDEESPKHRILRVLAFGV